MTSPAQVDDDAKDAPRTRDRDLTEKRLVEAALEILSDEGVLAGINLRDVAKRAGVARGNIYNYFGSRRQLLRRALSVRIAELDDFRGVSNLPFVKRKMRLVGGDDRHLQAGELVALLVIDRDDEVTPMPFFDDAMSRMQQNLDDGDIGADYDDLEALHIAIHAATRGYNLLRPAYARQLDVPVDELDARVRVIFEDWLQHVAAGDSTANGKSAA